MEKRLGFIGLGNMGNPMANRLIDAGYLLTVHDARAAAMDPLVRRGAQAASSPKEVACAAEVVALSLPTPSVVHEVLLGTNGVREGTQVKTVIDLSTTGPRMATEVAAGLASENIACVDSPVSGGIAGAVKGTLAVMVSSPRPLFEALEPILEVIGKVHFIGEKAGMGQTMKLVNNLLSATALAATSEAVVMGVKAGLDPQVMIDVFNAGSGMNTASRDKFPQSILPRSFDFGFATGLLYKDLKLCLDEAEALGVPMMVGNAVKQIWFLAHQKLGPDSDFSEIVKIPEGWAGVEVKGK
jgi:3-hydroxyisobutyrate dehydrogenase-like beta-hydroxyacid dehydrogenase